VLSSDIQFLYTEYYKLQAASSQLQDTAQLLQKEATFPRPKIDAPQNRKPKEIPTPENALEKGSCF
jgi:hypothetical protein